jgi:uncharacterized membrane protein
MSDRRLDVALAMLLRVGVMLAAVVTLAGGVLWLRRAGGTVVEWRTFRGEPLRLEHVASVAAAARAGQAAAVIQLGILLLIATPIARVFFSLVSFALRRDVMYVGVTLVVLVVLLWSLVGLRF